MDAPMSLPRAALARKVVILGQGMAESKGDSAVFLSAAELSLS